MRVKPGRTSSKFNYKNTFKVYITVKIYYIHMDLHVNFNNILQDINIMARSSPLYMEYVILAIFIRRV